VVEEIGDSRGEQWAVVTAAIRERRSNLNVDPDRPVAREVIDDLIALAVTAPNHYRTNPWRFVVLTGAARARIGAVAAEAVARQPDAKESIIERQRSQFLRAPVVIVAASAPDDDPIKHFENKHSVAAGVQNMLLGATAVGLASAWRSGLAMVDPAVSEPVKAALGLAPADEIVAFVYLGHPIGPPGVRDVPPPNARHLEH
jgi:nitroreductase